MTLLVFLFLGSILILSLSFSQFDTRALVNLVDENTHYKVLLVLDGFDELSLGVNKHIEQIIGISKERRQLFHWCVLLTSRYRFLHFLDQ